MAEQSITRGQRCFTKQTARRTQAAERVEKCRFCHWWPWHLTLTLKLDARYQTRLPCECGANPFIRSQDISYKNKKKHRQMASKTESSAVHCVTVKRIILKDLLLLHGQVTIIFVVSVCLSVCLCRVFLSRLRSDLDQTRTHATCPGL